jgi:hypothetical protein
VVFPGADLEARARSEGSIVEGFSWNAPFPRRSIFAGPSEVLYEPPAAPLWAIKVLTLAAGRTSLGSAARAALRRLAAAAERTFTAPNR